MSPKDFHIRLVLRRPPPFRLDEHARRVQLAGATSLVHIIIDLICPDIVVPFRLGVHGGLISRRERNNKEEDFPM